MEIHLNPAYTDFEKSGSIEAALKSAAIISAMIKAAENDQMIYREVIKDNLIGTDYKTSSRSSTVERFLTRKKQI